MKLIVTFAKFYKMRCSLSYYKQKSVITYNIEILIATTCWSDTPLIYRSICYNPHVQTISHKNNRLQHLRQKYKKKNWKVTIKVKVKIALLWLNRSEHESIGMKFRTMINSAGRTWQSAVFNEVFPFAGQCMKFGYLTVPLRD